jgi:hypothetical protein
LYGSSTKIYYFKFHFSENVRTWNKIEFGVRLVYPQVYFDHADGFGT